MKKSDIKDFLLYFVVGGIATISEWLFFYLLGVFNVHYAPSTAVAYVLSTLVNWGVGRLLVFKGSKLSLVKDIASVYLASIVGLLLNLLIMWLAVELFQINEMLSKIIATAIVFLYNFLVRKLVIYRK